MAMARKRKLKVRRPLAISIRGEGIAIDARLSAAEVGRVLSDGLAGLRDSIQAVAHGPEIGDTPEHDFDIVHRVIMHAETPVLQAIIDLARQALDQRMAN